mmetsp:Transcript_37442/g.37783  ORF Transcript_37442/g.37783 Transcript_37442/m.37783 type:complete len:282 (-) Transcript_37442:237-1082(-)
MVVEQAFSRPKPRFCLSKHTFYIVLLVTAYATKTRAFVHTRLSSGVGLHERSLGVRSTCSTALPRKSTSIMSSYSEYTVELSKPLGIILEECGGGQQSGVQVGSLLESGSAIKCAAKIVPGDVLLRVFDSDVSSSQFDDVMDLIVSSPENVKLTFGDGLGAMDIVPNLAKQLSAEDAVFADQVVRSAVREIRGDGRPAAKKLGDLLRVEIVIGAGVQDSGRRCLVRFFALFSRDGSSTYSCSVSATGVRNESNESIDIVSLSCAKDEGWGQTIDLKQENKK